MCSCVATGVEIFLKQYVEHEHQKNMLFLMQLWEYEKICFDLRSHDETKHKKRIIIPTSQSMHLSTNITGLQLQPMEERRE